MEISGGIDICQMSFPTGATAILLLVCILSLLSTKCPAQKIAPDSRIIKSERYSFVCVLRVDWLPGPDTPMQPPRHRARFPAASILRSARFSRMQTTKKPHGYHKIAVWQKDDRIRKSPLKFYAHYYSILSEDCQASIIMELWRLSVVFRVTLWHMRNSVWFCTRSEWACSPMGRPPISPIHSVRYWIGYSRLGMLLDMVKYPDLP